ncbi:hypothetical protein TNCT_332191 [Trichonephila clavata]|uniref:Uncharacterized protein n=1 Tax=Trichonephila clavata TaxID=2740835 RepID=A0A8X6JIL9_TRICU|nr:hypothetical protein TNCT_332191 [Trichonephila clavata]
MNFRKDCVLCPSIFSKGLGGRIQRGKKRSLASARVNCLEGSYANRYTTDASEETKHAFYSNKMQRVKNRKMNFRKDCVLCPSIFSKGLGGRIQRGKKRSLRRTRVNCLEGSYANRYTTDASEETKHAFYSNKMQRVKNRKMNFRKDCVLCPSIFSKGLG